MKRYHKYRFPKSRPLKGDWMRIFCLQFPYPYNKAKHAGTSVSLDEVYAKCKTRTDGFLITHP